MTAMPWIIAAATFMIGLQLITDGRRAFRIVRLLILAVAVLVVLVTIVR